MPVSLFADDVSAGAFAGMAGGAVTVIGAIWMVVRQFFGDRSTRQSTEKKEIDEADKVKRVDTIAELEKMMTALRSDFSEYKKESRADLANMEIELEGYRTKSQDCDRKTDRMSSHIFYLEGIMRKAGMDFVPWVEVEAGTGLKAALKTPAKEGK